MTLNADDVAAARRILAEHETRFGTVPMIQTRPVPTPTGHPDYETLNDDPDADIAQIESLAEEIEWRLKYLGGAVTKGVTSIYNRMRAEFNDRGTWTPLAHLIHDAMRFQEIGRQIREEF